MSVSLGSKGLPGKRQLVQELAEHTLTPALVN
jgi:hypothetical protein